MPLDDRAAEPVSSKAPSAATSTAALPSDIVSPPTQHPLSARTYSGFEAPRAQNRLFSLGYIKFTLTASQTVGRGRPCVSGVLRGGLTGPATPAEPVSAADSASSR